MAIDRKPKTKMFENRIKLILKQKNMNMQELSDLSGIVPSHLSRIINGKRLCISLPIAIKISEILETPVEQVFIYREPIAEPKERLDGE